MRIALIIATAIAASTSAPAVALELPTYNPAEYCTSVSEAVGGSARIYNSCIEREQEAYDAIKLAWPEIDERPRAYCDDVASAIGGSYRLMASCIEREMEARNATTEFKF